MAIFIMIRTFGTLYVELKEEKFLIKWDFQFISVMDIDHIKPIAKGGKTTYDNLQTLCRRCNKEKGDTY